MVSSCVRSSPFAPDDHRSHSKVFAASASHVVISCVSSQRQHDTQSRSLLNCCLLVSSAAHSSLNSTLTLVSFDDLESIITITGLRQDAQTILQYSGGSCDQGVEVKQDDISRTFEEEDAGKPGHSADGKVSKKPLRKRDIIDEEQYSHQPHSHFGCGS